MKIRLLVNCETCKSYEFRIKEFWIKDLWCKNEYALGVWSQHLNPNGWTKVRHVYGNVFSNAQGMLMYPYGLSQYSSQVCFRRIRCHKCQHPEVKNMKDVSFLDVSNAVKKVMREKTQYLWEDLDRPMTFLDIKQKVEEYFREKLNDKTFGLDEARLKKVLKNLVSRDQIKVHYGSMLYRLSSNVVLEEELSEDDKYKIKRNIEKIKKIFG